MFVHPEDIVILSLRGTVDGDARLKAIKIDSQTLSSLLFCGIDVHKVALYLSNIEEFCIQKLDRETF